MAIVARASLTRRTLAACLAVLLCACSPTPSVAPSAPASSSSAAPPSEVATCQGVTVPPVSPQPDWADRVFYEVFVRSFQDSNGDGIGDLAGLTDRLDYLNDGDPSTSTDLGITGIWLMPVAESPSYHGYDVTDYTAVEHDYGDAAALRAFVAAAHTRGISVIVDFVINHTSSQHPWFKDALAGGSHHDWYVWSDEDPHWPSVAGGNPWHLASNGEWFYGAFWEGMPDLNLRNPEVTAEIERIASVWLDEFGVDGFRIDAAKHLIEDDADHQINTPETLAWLTDFSGRIHERHPGVLLIGEVYDLTLVSASYVPDAVDLTFDFELANKMLLGARVAEAASLASQQRDTLRRYGDNPYGAFLTNHDQTRTMSTLTDPGSGRAAASLLLTNPGVPFVYYGEEIGLTGAKPDERIRSPMPWTSAGGGGFSSGMPWEPLEEGTTTLNVAAEAGDPASLLSHYRRLIRVRGEHPAFAAGTFSPLASASDKVYGFVAAQGSDRVAVIVNLGSSEDAAYDLSLASPATCGVTSATMLYADGIPSSGSLPPPAVTGGGTFTAWRPVPVLPAYSTLLVELD